MSVFSKLLPGKEVTHCARFHIDHVLHSEFISSGANLIKCSLCRHEDLCSNPQLPTKKLDMVAHTCNPRTSGKERRNRPGSLAEGREWWRKIPDVNLLHSTCVLKQAHTYTHTCMKWVRAVGGGVTIVAQAGLSFAPPLPVSPERCDYTHVPSCLDGGMFSIREQKSFRRDCPSPDRNLREPLHCWVCKCGILLRTAPFTFPHQKHEIMLSRIN